MLFRKFLAFGLVMGLTGCTGDVELKGQDFDPNHVDDAPLIDRRSEFQPLSTYPRANVLVDFNTAQHGRFKADKGYAYTIQFDAIMGIPGSANVSYKKHRDEFTWKNSGALVNGRRSTNLTDNMGQVTVRRVIMARQPNKYPLHVFGAIPLVFSGTACDRGTIETLLDDRLPKIKDFLKNAIERQSLRTYGNNLPNITPFYEKLGHDLQVRPRDINKSIAGCSAAVVNLDNLDTLVGQHVVLGITTANTTAPGIAAILNDALLSAGLENQATFVGIIAGANAGLGKVRAGNNMRLMFDTGALAIP